MTNISLCTVLPQPPVKLMERHSQHAQFAFLRLYLHPEAAGIRSRPKYCSEALRKIRDYFGLDWSAIT